MEEEIEQKKTGLNSDYDDILSFLKAENFYSKDKITYGIVKRLLGKAQKDKEENNWREKILDTETSLIDLGYAKEWIKKYNLDHCPYCGGLTNLQQINLREESLNQQLDEFTQSYDRINIIIDKLEKIQHDFKYAKNAIKQRDECIKEATTRYIREFNFFKKLNPNPNN